MIGVNLPQIKKSAQINGYSKITLHNITLSEDDGIIEMDWSFSELIDRMGSI